MHPDIFKRPLLWLLILLIAGISFFYKPTAAPQDIRTFIAQKEVTLRGQVTGFYTPKPKSNNVIVKVFSVGGKTASGYVYARMANFVPQWKDTLEITGRLQEPYGIDLLGNFNWRAYLAQKHVFAEIKSSNVRVVKPAAWPWRVLRGVRADILRVFERSFPPDLAQIAGGILLGERGELAPELLEAFQDSGAIHLLVASGGNVGFVTLMTMAVCGWVRLRRKKALAVALAVAGIYTLMAGADAPLMRAYFMSMCACAGYYLGRNSGVWQGLVLSCAIILIVQPASLFETGFIMSFLATAGLIMGLANYPVPQKWPQSVRFLAQIFVATVSVQLVLLPVFTNVFYKVSLIGLVANMVLVPLASVLLALTFAFYVLSKLQAGIVLFYPTEFALWGFEELVRWFAAFKMAALPVSAWGTGTVAAYYAGVFLLLWLPVKKVVRKAWIPAVAMMILAIGWQIWQNHTTQIYILDQWHKNTVLIKTAGGNLWVVGGELKPKIVAAALRKLGRKEADVVFLTKTSVREDFSALAKEVVRPFEDAWPDEKDWKFGKTSARIIWGLHLTSAGKIWQNIGYSGSKEDSVSYCFSQPRLAEYCVGAHGSFVQLVDKTIEPVTNQTVKVKL